MKFSCEKEKEGTYFFTAFLLYYIACFYITVHYYYPNLLFMKCINKK
jgi:hypothetical protein